MVSRVVNTREVRGETRGAGWFYPNSVCRQAEILGQG